MLYPLDIHIKMQASTKFADKVVVFVSINTRR